MIVEIMMNILLFMSNDVVSALKSFLEIFAKNGLTTVQGEIFY